MLNYIMKLVETYEQVLSIILIQIERGTGINRFFFFIDPQVTSYKIIDNLLKISLQITRLSI